MDGNKWIDAFILCSRLNQGMHFITVYIDEETPFVCS